MGQPVILGWVVKNPRLHKQLHKLTWGQRFLTIRPGLKWAHKLTPGGMVILSVSDDPQTPHVVGYAKVASVKKAILCYCVDANDLKDAIGAKTWTEVRKDLRLAYGKDKVNPWSTISIIELFFWGR